MKVLILGGTGMLGHKLYQTMEEPVDAWTAVRGASRDLSPYSFFCPDRVIGEIDATDHESIQRAFGRVQPDAVVNCIGIVKQHALAKDASACEAINARLPHVLAALCREYGARLVHISTDCVFNGQRGNYTENDLTDAEDLYGQSKARGETLASNAITLRTSIIGRELREGFGLVEWFLSATRPARDAGETPAIPGYTHARFSGLTTHELSRVIQMVLLKQPSLSGIYQVSSEPIDKCSLLELLRDAYGRSNPISRCDEVRIDRTLDSSRFRQATGYTPPSWPEMVRKMASDPTPYGSWRLR